MSIKYVEISNGGTVASFDTTFEGMVLTVATGFYSNGIGSFSWDETSIDVPTPINDANFVIWVLSDGTISAGMKENDLPTVPPNMVDRISWGKIPSGCVNLEQAEINVLKIV